MLGRISNQDAARGPRKATVAIATVVVAAITGFLIALVLTELGGEDTCRSDTCADAAGIVLAASIGLLLALGVIGVICGLALAVAVVSLFRRIR